MAQNETWLKHDLLEAVKVQYLDGNLFSMDNAGNLIGVTLTRDGEDYSGGGSVSANVIRSDGGTVAVTGALSGKTATVVLPQAAYAVPGVVSIVVKLTASGQVTTIAALVANVYRSSTETAVDPGTIIPSIQTLISQINTAVASIPADYSAIWTKLAPAFSTDASYVAGQYVTYNSGLYRFKTSHSGSWSSSDVTAVNLGGEITDLKSALKYDFVQPVIISNNLFNKNTIHHGGYYIMPDQSHPTGYNQSADWAYSEPIDVSGFSQISKTTGAVVFYEADGTPISSATGSTTPQNVPSNASYIIFSVLETNVATAHINKGGTLLKYDDYAIKIPTDGVIQRDIFYIQEIEINKDAKTITFPVRTTFMSFSTGRIARVDVATKKTYTVAEGKAIVLNSNFEKDLFYTDYDKAFSIVDYNTKHSGVVVIANIGTKLHSEIQKIAQIINTEEPKSEIPFPDRLTYLYTDNKPNNLIDKSKITEGKYIDSAGVIHSGSDYWMLSDSISVTPGQNLYFNGISITCFFNADNSFNSYVQNVTSTTVPTGAAYLICCYPSSRDSYSEISTEQNAPYDEGLNIVSKKPYQYGFIDFTVKVRQTKSNNTVSADQVSEGTDDSLDVNCVLTLPQTYSQFNKPCRLLMMCHGAGGGTDYWKENSAYQSLVNTFVSGGYAVFDCSGFKNESPGLNFWGDPRGVDCWRKAYQYVVDNYNVEKQFSIYGFSMGGLTTMNLVFSRFPNIKCVAIASPVLSLEASYNDSGVNQVIKNLYGMGDTYDKTKAYGSDPYAHIFTYDNTPYVFDALPPLKIWYGSTETGGGVDAEGKPNLVGGAVNKYIAECFIEAINNAGGLAEYREVQGAGHEICYGGNSVCRTDYLRYLDRHNY